MILLKWFLKESARDYWVKNYSNFDPKDSTEGHWGKGQTGFNISKSGKIYLSDNKKVKDELGEWGYPNHRDLVVGSGDDKTVYSGIYSWFNGIILWLYPATEFMWEENPTNIEKGLASLIGVHKITKDTPVYSNTSRNILFRLGDVV